MLIDALSYPVRGNGRYMLIGAAVVFAIAHFVSGMALVIVSIFMTAMLARVIGMSARGDKNPPAWPELTSFVNDIMPVLEIWAAILVSFLPAIIVLCTSGMSLKSNPVPIISVLALGVFYCPMAMLSIVLHSSFASLSPHVVIPAIIKILPQYCVTVFILLAAVALKIYTSMGIGEDTGMIAIIAADVVGVYIMLVQGYMIGRIYAANHERIGWFE